MPVKEYLVPEDTSLIEEAALCLRDKVLIRLLRKMAGRVSEVLSLEEKHIDFSRGLVKIEHEKHLRSLYCPHCYKEERTRLAKTHKFCPTCTKPVVEPIVKITNVPLLRKVPVDRDTLELIRIYIKGGGIKVVNGKRMLFAITRQRAWQIVKDCAERVGIFELINPKNDRKHHVHPHSFRDAFVVNAIKKKPTADDLRLIQELLGHQNYDTTMQYRKVEADELRTFYNDLMKEEK